MNERAKILVVDDDESVRKVLEAILEETGYIVETAENAREAIKKTHAEHFNLALTDIRLPDMEGTELLTKMKETIPKMRKVMITGYPSMRNAVDALNKGADAYITKPFNMDDVLRTIKEQLTKQKEEKRYGQERVAEFIETRVKELEKQETIVHKKRR